MHLTLFFTLHHTCTLSLHLTPGTPATADNQKSVDAAAKIVAELINPKDDIDNDWKRIQLRELAMINGTLRDENDHFKNEMRQLAKTQNSDSVYGAGATADNAWRLTGEQQEMQMSKDWDILMGVGRPSNLAARPPQPASHLTPWKPAPGGAPAGVPGGSALPRAPGGSVLAPSGGGGSSKPGDCAVWVGGLPSHYDDSTLHELFTPYGNVSSCSVVLDRATGASRNFGFVNFSTEEDGLAAIHAINALRISDFDGRVIQARLKGTNAPPPAPAQTALPWAGGTRPQLPGALAGMPLLGGYPVLHGATPGHAAIAGHPGGMAMMAGKAGGAGMGMGMVNEVVVPPRGQPGFAGAMAALLAQQAMKNNMGAVLAPKPLWLQQLSQQPQQPQQPLQPQQSLQPQLSQQWQNMRPLQPTVNVQETEGEFGDFLDAVGAKRTAPTPTPTQPQPTLNMPGMGNMAAVGNGATMGMMPQMPPQQILQGGATPSQPQQQQYNQQQWGVQQQQMPQRIPQQMLPASAPQQQQQYGQQQWGMQQQQQQQQQQMPKMGGGAAPLPPGWQEAVDPASGKTYYMNHISKETAWDRPV